MKPLIIGEANPYQSSEEDAMRYAMYPKPVLSAGWYLCVRVMGMTERDYLRTFDRIDLCHPKWSIVAARAKAAELIAERGKGDIIILCGVKVAAAFEVPVDPFRVYRDEPPLGLTPTLITLPHPSGLNRVWHQPDSIRRARAVLREAGIMGIPT